MDKHNEFCFFNLTRWYQISQFRHSLNFGATKSIYFYLFNFIFFLKKFQFPGPFSFTWSIFNFLILFPFPGLISISFSFFNFSTKVVVLLTFLYRADFFDTYYGRKGCRNITALLKVENNRCGRFFLEIFWNLLEYCPPLKMSKNWENNMWVLPKDPLTFIEWKKRKWWKYRTIFW